MDLPLRVSFDEVLSQLTLANLPAQSGPPKKVLFWGEGTGEISSYVAGWMASQGVEVIVLDGANRFDPYMVSSLAKKALISPERLLKRIRIARAFTCYQMATLIGERLTYLLREEGKIASAQKPWVILLGPLTTFLDEDVPEREVGPLFERSLRRMEVLAMEGIPFLLFQASVPYENPPFSKGGRRRPEPSLLRRSSASCEGRDYGAGRVGGLMDSKRAYLMRKLFQFSNWVWEVSLDDEGPKVVLKKGLIENFLSALERRGIPINTLSPSGGEGV
jgi:hypothetical protein